MQLRSLEYRRTAYASAWLTAICGFLYSVLFLLTKNSTGFGLGVTGFFLIAGGLFGASALLGLYERLRSSGGTYALWALVFGLGGALAAALHGGTDLANAIHPTQAAAMPSPVDPRGLGTFGLASLSLLGFAYLLRRDSSFPRLFGVLGYVSGALLILTYLGRLIVLDASSPLVLAPAGLEGFIVNPIWYAWLGLSLRRGA